MADTATIEKPAEQAKETPVFDSAAFIARRNAQQGGKEPPAAEPAKPATPAKPAAPAATATSGEDAGDTDEDDESTSTAATPGKPGAPPHMSNRAARKELNRLREELGFERGQKAMLQALIDQGFTKKEAAAQVEEAADPEPKREQFATDAEYAKAIGRYEGRQAAQEAQANAEADQETARRAQAAKAKYDADIKTFPDWEEMKVKMASIPLVAAEQPELVSAVLVSDLRAKVLYHWAKNPESLKPLLALKGHAQLLAFTRLEGRLESMYNQPTATGAGSEPPSKERTPEKPAQGGKTAAELDSAKPRPTADVAARGGTAAPDEPAIGSAAWMARKNAERNGR